MRGAALGLVAVAFLPAAAWAETSKTFTVGATIAKGCAVTVGGANGRWGDIDLGSVTGLAAQTASASLLSSGVAGLLIDCTPGTSIDVTADQGDHAAGGVRQMVNASHALSTVPYQLFANNSQTPWTGQAVTLQFAVGVQHQSLPIRAVATLSGPTRGGAYSDTVRITIAW